jgi:hypothetical protein
LIANTIAVAPQFAHPTFNGVPRSESYETRHLLDEEKRSHLPRSADAPKRLVDANHFMANGSNFQWTRGIVRYDRVIVYILSSQVLSIRGYTQSSGVDFVHWMVSTCRDEKCSY